MTLRGRSVLLLAGISPLAGCYTTRPAVSAPVPGSMVMLDLTDRARVDLGSRIGPSAARIDGVVEARNESAYVVRVSSVTYLNGQSNKWSNEALTVPASLVVRARLREFSRSRTTAVGLGIAAAIAAVFLKADFFGSSGPDRDPGTPPGGET